MSKRIKSVIAASMLLTSQMAFAIEREDVLECGLPNGDKFVLTSKYDYSIGAKLLKPIARHPPAERLNVHPYNIDFLPKTGLLDKYPPAYVSRHTDQLIACFNVAMIDDIPIVNSSYRRDDGTWFDKRLIPNKLYLSPVIKEQTQEIRQQLIVLGDARPAFDYALLVPKNGRLVYEIALSSYKDNQKGQVVGVYQSTSVDDGKTWSDPIITKDARIYELGKSILEQSFIARPISFNGKKIEAHFPPPINQK